MLKTKKHSKKINLILSTLLFSFYGQNSFAEENKNDNDFKFSGNIVVKSELDARDFKNSTTPLFYTSLRTTLGVEKYFFDKFKVFLQIRDSRLMGEETTLFTNMKNLDLHQGYVVVKNIFDSPLSFQAGRFENSYATQRFMGAGDWHYVGRSFDGFKLNYKNKEGFDFNLDIFDFISNNFTPYISNATPTAYKDLPTSSNDILGFWAKSKISEAVELNLFTIKQNNKKQSKQGFNDLDLTTLGGTYIGNYGDLSSILEGAYQLGNYSDLSTNAYLASAQVFYNFSGLKVGLGADILSGNNPDSTKTKNVFSASLGTNHSFYGYMDYFTDIPTNTGNLGLNDYYLTTSWSNKNFPLSATLNIHHFMSNQSAKTGENTFGQEADLVLKYAILEKTNFILGVSMFIPSNLMKKEGFFKDVSDNSYWSYASIVSNF